MKYFVCFISLILLFTSCAKVGAPDGGPKDILPPQVMASSPDSAALLVSTSSVILQFDENVQTKEIQKNLFISPAIKEDPKILVKGKRLEINFSQTLDSNTTYIFQFLDAIADLNEGNVLSQYQLSFSTGATMDTFSISGRITRLLDGTPSEALVFLYHIDSAITDSFLLKKPIYITKSDKEGFYHLPFLKKQSYRIVAFEDKNKNRIADKDEPIGTSLSTQNENDHNIELSVPRIDLSNVKLIQHGKSQVPGRYYLLFNEPLAPNTALSFNGNISLGRKKQLTTVFQMSTHRDTVYFFPLFEDDSLSLQIILGDTHHYSLKLPFDTLSRTYHTPQISNRPKQHRPYIELSSVYPVLKTNSLAVQLIQDSIKINIDSIIIENPFNLRIYAAFSIDHNYMLQFNSGALTYYLETVQVGTDTLKFSTRDFSQNAVGFNIILPDTNQTILIEMFNDQKKYTTTYIRGKAQFYDIEPGKYRLRAITDLNQNRIHDGIDYITLAPAETVLISNKQIEIKPEWDYENILISFVDESVDKRGQSAKE